MSNKIPFMNFDSHRYIRFLPVLGCLLLLVALTDRSQARIKPLIAGVIGISPVTQGETQTYTLSPGSATSWTCSCGTIQSSTSTTCTVYFNQLNCTSATITALNGSTTLGSKVVTVNAAPALVTGAISNPTQTISYNTIPAQINAAASTGGYCSSDSYQWYSSTDNVNYTGISGATGQNYQPGALTVTTYYKRSTICFFAGYTSNYATVTVLPPLASGTISPASQSINYNTAAASLTATAATGGNGSYSYQWYSSSNGSAWTAISGATSLTYAPGVLLATTYYQLVSSSNGVTVPSATATVMVYPPLVTGTVSPTSQTINYNTTATALTATAATGGAGSYTYQWYSSANGSTWTAISGATSLTYAPGALPATTYYQLVSTSNGSSVTSPGATITVYPQLVSGTVSPGSQTINYDITAGTLTATAATGGNGSYTYQWYSSPNGSTWTAISGATGLTYAAGALTTTTDYHLLSTSNGATVTSATATVTVYPQLVTGTVTPGSQAINYNTAASSLTATAPTGGSGSYTYQWQSSPNNSTWSNISAATALTYSPGTLTTTTYYRIISISNGIQVNSPGVVVTVYPQLVTGAVTPGTQTINYNTAAATLTATASTGGSGSYAYQWQSSPDNSTWSTISGATTLTYSPGTLTTTTYYRIISTSNGIQVNSAGVVVTVYPQLMTGTVTPGTQTINYNTAAATLTATAPTGGNNSYAYQWQSSPNNSAWSNISGATALTYSPGTLTVTTYYRIISVSNGVQVNSPGVVITVYPQLVTGTITPASQTLNYGTAVTALTGTPATGGSGSYTYQWYSSPNGSTWTAISGATGLTCTPGSITGTTYYYLISTSNGVSVPSGTATVTIYPQLVTGTVSPASQTLNYNTAATSLTAAAATGGNGSYTYQWYSSPNGSTWTAISGATGLTYTPGVMTATTYYHLVSTSNGISVTSGTSTATVYPQLVSGTINPASQTINYNTIPASLTATAATGGNNSYSYQWQDSSASTSGIWQNTGTNSLTFAPSALTITTCYRIASTSNSVTVYSNEATVKVYPQLSAGTISTGITSLPYGADPGDIQGTAAAGGNGSYAYQWDTSADGIHWLPVPGATIIPFDPGNLYSTTYVQLTVTSNGASATSNILSYTVASALNVPGSDTPPAGTTTLVPMPAIAYTSGSDSLNYIVSRTIFKPGIADTVTADRLTSPYDAHQSTTFFDGLGRSMETVDKQANPSQADLISTTFYDPFGRVSQKYLPYTDNQNTGTFRSNANTQQPAFYNTYFNNTESYYYSNTTYEASPLNRALQVSPPGNSWTGSGRGTVENYPVNTAADGVRIWTITYGETDYPGTVSTYAPGTLYITATTDENGHMTIEYKDLSGKIILKKVQEAANPSPGHDGWLCTYYVFDDLNNLRCVIPPKAIAAISNNGWNLSSVENLCFQYAYDYRNRMTLKKTPDAAPMYLIYNLKDLLVLTQDGNLRGQNQWTTIKYDSLERPVQSGIYAAASAYSLDQMQQNENNDQNYPESFTLNTQIYYDNYQQVSVPSFSSADVSRLISYTNSYPDPVTQSNQIRGLTTVRRARILEAPTTRWLTSVSYYDEKGRVIQTVDSNISGSADTTTISYDFSGKALSSYTRHNNAASKLNPRTTVLSAITYDHMGRPVKRTKQLNDNGVNKTIDSLVYDALGQLQQKSIGNQMESLTYVYNIRGWLHGINLPYLTTAGTAGHYFGEELNYDYGFGTPQYNGNISGVKWKSAGSDTTRAYGYLYDNVNRLIAANYTQNSTGNGTSYAPSGSVDFSVPQISYDANGNILTMNQRGLEGTRSNYIDQLTYSYNSASNQLQSVTDAAPVDSSYHLGDFQDGNTTGNDYAYDYVGNLKTDKNKGIDSIRYNYLNLPEYVHIKGKGTINYVYDAVGTKQQKIVIDSTRGGKADTTTYVGNFVYHSDTLQFMTHEEGRVRYFNTVSQITGAVASGLSYDYFIKDHLGDTRMVLTEQHDTAIYVATMEPDNAATEDSLFNNVSTTQSPTPVGFEPGSGGDTTNHYVSKLFGGTGGNRIGPSIVLKVMARDTITANVWGWYQGAVQPPPGNETPIVNDLLSTLSNDVLGQGGGEFGGGISPVSSALTAAISTFITNDENTEYSTAQPKAFLNWVLFDNQLNFVTGGTTQVPQIAAGQSKQEMQATLPPSMPNNGYLYIYLSNESQDTVYFNNLNIQYNRGPITEEEHYYPFGLTMAGISSQALQFGQYNKYRFNGGSEQQNKEFSDGSGLELYDAQHRMYDQQTGRFGQIDPLAYLSDQTSCYAFVHDNPILSNDPTGLADSTSATTSTKPPPQKKPPHYIQLADIVIKAPGKPLKGGEFNGQIFGDIAEERHMYNTQEKKIFTLQQARNDLAEELEELRKAEEIFKTGGDIGKGNLTSPALLSVLIDLLRRKAEFTMVIALAAQMYAEGMKFGMSGDDLQKVIMSYIDLHSSAQTDNPTQAKGVYEITTSESIQSASSWGAGLSEWITRSFYYDIATKQFLGEVRYIP